MYSSMLAALRSRRTCSVASSHCPSALPTCLYSSLPTPALWRFRGGKTVRVRGRFAVNHGESLRQAAIDGLGIGYMPTFVVGEDLKAGRLVSVLDDHAHSVQKVWAVHPRSENLAPKVRAFIDFLVGHFEAAPPGGGSLPA